MKRVYFIKPIGFDGPIKIGITRDVGRRLDDLMKWSPLDLHLICSIDGGPRTEARIHRMLAETHRHKEWFHPSAKLSRLIERIQDGSYREELLPEDDRPLWFERHARIIAFRKPTRKSQTVTQ